MVGEEPGAAMTTVAVIVSDRPPDLYLRDCHDNLNQYLPVDVHVHVVDDTEHRLGMAGAVRAAWAWALEQDADYLLHVEEDFRFIDLPLLAMARILNTAEHLAQVVLKRQAWSDEEKRAGGQIETNPMAYTQHERHDLRWVEHSTLFSLNPCLIPRRTLELAWEPGGAGAERAITDACLAAGMRFAYYGKVEDPARCEHVGHIRSPGYRW